MVQLIKLYGKISNELLLVLVKKNKLGKNDVTELPHGVVVKAACRQSGFPWFDPRHGWSGDD